MSFYQPWPRAKGLLHILSLLPQPLVSFLGQPQTWTVPLSGLMISGLSVGPIAVTILLCLSVNGGIVSLLWGHRSAHDGVPWAPHSPALREQSCSSCSLM